MVFRGLLAGILVLFVVLKLLIMDDLNSDILGLNVRGL